MPTSGIKANLTRGAMETAERHLACEQVPALQARHTRQKFCHFRMETLYRTVTDSAATNRLR